jgi:transcriptional regulator with XRE-family HTH domain
MQVVKTGTLISEARKAKSLTQKDVAQALHISVQAVSKWERGLNFPDIALLEPLGELLDLTVSELLSGERNAPAGEEAVRSSLRMSLTQLGGKARHWRQLFVALAIFVICVGGFLGYRWVRDNTELLPQRETVIIPRDMDDLDITMARLLGNDVVGSMDMLRADDLYELCFQLELWEGEKRVDCQQILAGEGWGKGEVPRHGSLSYLLQVKDGEVVYTLFHDGAVIRSRSYDIPEAEGWGWKTLTQPTKVNRETGTILACISIDTGSGIRTIGVGNLEKPNLLEGATAVVLRMTVN